MNNGSVKNARPGNAPQRRTADPKLLAILRGGMVLFGGMIVVLGLLLVILPAFRVKKIEVVGAQYYTEEQIIACSGISVGDELLATDVDAAIEGIIDSCEYVDSVSVSSKSITTLKIEIKEKSNLMYTAFNGKYIAFDDQFHVLSQNRDPEAYADLLYVELPQIAALSVGGTIHFANPDTDMEYVRTLLAKLEEKAILSRVTSVDFSKKYAVSYVLENSYVVELGKVGELETKLLLVEEILKEKKALDSYAVIDVSSVQKPTYRVVGEADALMK